jgi:hypothetical protein
MLELQKKAKGERPRYFEDPAIDKVLSITLALAGEVAVLRDRIDTIERLGEAGQPISRAAVDSYQPDETVRAERDAWRDTFLSVVLRTVHQELEDLERKAEQQPYSTAIDTVEGRGQATDDRVM